MDAMEYTRSTDIVAAPDRIWAVMSDIERWHEWTPSITSVGKLDAGPLAVGTRARVRQPKLPQAEWVVTWLEPGAGFIWVSRAPGAVVTARHVIARTAEGGRVTLSVGYEGIFGRLIGRLTKSLNERYLGFEADGLKARCEAMGDTSAPRPRRPSV